jgi:antitoxin VapB
MIRPRSPIRAFTDLGNDPMSESVKRESKAKGIAKIFMHGRSQAVRLPKEYRFEGNEVLVSKVGNKVILEPLRKEPIDVEALWAELDQGFSSRRPTRRPAVDARRRYLFRLRLFVVLSRYERDHFRDEPP